MAAALCRSIFSLSDQIVSRSILSARRSERQQSLVLVQTFPLSKWRPPVPYRPISTEPKTPRPLGTNRTDLYSIMSISPSATQAQIKEAYYKLSMKYHPDRNKGNPDTTSRFREITEAYSVLGNNKTRRKYDKGLLRDYPPPPHAHKSQNRSGGNAQARPGGGETTIKYDFDAFYHSHYGEALKREQAARRNKKSEPGMSIAVSGISQQLLIFGVSWLVILIGWHFGLKKYATKLKDQQSTLK